MPLTDSVCEKCACWFSFNDDYGKQPLCKKCRIEHSMQNEITRECMTCGIHFNTSHIKSRSCLSCYQKWKASQTFTIVFNPKKENE